jgi:hypothetical protein
VSAVRCPFGCGFILTEQPEVRRRERERTARAVLLHHRRRGRCEPGLRLYPIPRWRRLLRLASRLVRR